MITHKIISINRLRTAVTFLQGTFHPKHSTAICFEVSLFDISVELSPFAVKSMFWLSSEPIRLQEITYPDLVVARTVQSYIFSFQTTTLTVTFINWWSYDQSIGNTWGTRTSLKANTNQLGWRFTSILYRHGEGFASLASHAGVFRGARVFKKARVGGYG